MVGASLLLWACGGSTEPAPTDVETIEPTILEIEAGTIQLSGVIECSDANHEPGTFIDKALEAGVDFERPMYHPEGTEQAGFVVREGGGIAARDFDGDGVVDLYVSDSAGPDLLYLSAGRGPWKYQAIEVPESSEGAISAVVTDLDNDGHPDVLVGGEGFRLLHNNGDLTFTDRTEELGIFFPEEPLFSLSVADIDKDGLLDILALGHKFEKEKDGPAWPPTPYADVLIRATGIMSYEDVREWIPAPSKSEGVGYTGTWFDADDDNDPDLYIVNDFGSLLKSGNRLLLNEGLVDGKILLKDVSKETQTYHETAGMGCAFGDYDRDGDYDLYFTAIGPGTTLLRQEHEDFTFTDVGLSANAKAPIEGAIFHGWGASFVDVDNDGWLDLYVGHGYLHQVLQGCSPGDVGCSNSLEQPDTFLLNDEGIFLNKTEYAGLGNTLPTRSVITADLNRDGFMDIIVGSTWGHARLYMNGCDDSPWLEVRLVGNQSNRDGVGAKVTVEADGITQVREIEAGSQGLWGSNEPIAHFGLGGATVIDKLTVRWPSGAIQEFEDIEPRQYVVVGEP
jgi:hypothetical protein